MKRFLPLRLTALVCAVGSLVACSTTPQFDKHFSLSTRKLLSSQVIDPNASRADPSGVGKLDGKSAKGVMDGYHGSFKSGGGAGGSAALTDSR